MLHPRELLARWAREEALPPLELGTAAVTNLGQSEPVPAPAEPAPPPAVAYAAGPIPVPPQAVRIDPSHPRGPAPVSLPQHTAAAPPSASLPHHPTAPLNGPYSAPPLPPQAYMHWGHPGIPAPHFATTPVPASASNSPRLAQMVTGVGILGLTLGTGLLLYSRFYLPEVEALLAAGWVVAAVSQLILLLGIVMLVSVGLQQTSQEVASRVNHLGERLTRIEYASWGRGDGSPPQG